VTADDFFWGLFETAGPHDVLTAIRVPAATNTRVGFAEFARRHGDYAGGACRVRPRRAGLSDAAAHLESHTRQERKRHSPGQYRFAATALAGDLVPSDDAVNRRDQASRRRAARRVAKQLMRRSHERSAATSP
jgi:carbon-monoxide dehydrogenase medium subunit